MSKNQRPHKANTQKFKQADKFSGKSSNIRSNFERSVPEETVAVTLSGLGYGGQALYKGQGLVLFVPRGLPGDKVLLKIKKLKKNYGTAEIIKVVEPSPYRVNPQCMAFEQGCGGCQWLHLEYGQQLLHKTHIMRETLKHLGKLNVKVNPTLGMKKPFAYRNKLSLHKDESGQLGLCREHTVEVIACADCRQELPVNMQAYRVLSQMTLPAVVTQVHIRSNPAGELGLYFFAERLTSPTDKSWYVLVDKLKKELPALQGVGVKIHHENKLLSGLPHIIQKLGHIDYAIPLGSFFQTNYEMADRMLALVQEMAAPQPEEQLLDLYSGVGFFSLYLARSVRAVLGLESDTAAVEAAGHNAQLNRLKNVQFKACDVKRGLQTLQPGQYRKIILDPPRMGCEEAVLRELIRLKPHTIVYISCAPDTLARDLRILADGGFNAEVCQPLDMFPQTYHIESVVKLVRQV
jgi:23S rRNA (uracil1939-C5)-methyltransferase